MPAKDLYHDAVKSALMKAGWVIVADPYRIQDKDVDWYTQQTDIRPIAAEREGRKIVVVIQKFVGRSLMIDFHHAVGQHVVYRSLMQARSSEYQSYMAIDDIIYENLFKREGIAFLTRKSQINLLVVDIEGQEIVEWIS
ncbi:MAG: element excision factor XisH family protein [Hormoscilla sp.]